ncbi:hypothetical protein XA68_10618 [Ophiocordyceps unilateralis]|uniref:Uncharacterized protein n=1 Tax=Ophiocordyceps unilateralis TaxID=268505 RepID=A0A2A9NYT8_OPHUN|nr:hypothetical protein XA68_10618 [Ophiocordyceps unilateralis]
MRQYYYTPSDHSTGWRAKVLFISHPSCMRREVQEPRAFIRAIFELLEYLSPEPAGSFVPFPPLHSRLSPIMADNVDPSRSQQSKRQAAILGRFLPEGYSADAEVSLSTDTVEDPTNDSGPTSRFPSPSPLQPPGPDSTTDRPSLISHRLVSSLPMSCHIQNKGNPEVFGVNTCNTVPASVAPPPVTWPAQTLKAS